ncbi:hypothetical protein GUJ93_ZPchr0006g43919 [Zizania palustris]|uniref:Uncharacterized protein n=1 Tax=Zizania palustris TaxID=103762 RepID=A0A8J5VNP7_ZIZPA|nr:hypothetical protein GUJ93_ZPchr0006g43919 [Zizania palustris]
MHSASRERRRVRHEQRTPPLVSSSPRPPPPPSCASAARLVIAEYCSAALSPKPPPPPSRASVARLIVVEYLLRRPLSIPLLRPLVETTSARPVVAKASSTVPSSPRPRPPSRTA